MRPPVLKQDLRPPVLRPDLSPVLRPNLMAAGAQPRPEATTLGARRRFRARNVDAEVGRFASRG